MVAHASNRNFSAKPVTRSHDSHERRTEKHEKREAKIERNIRPEILRKCFNCGKPGHIAKNCFQPKKVAAMCMVNSEQRNYGRLLPVT